MGEAKFKAAPPAASAPAPLAGWNRDMAAAPKDGRPVALMGKTPDGKDTESEAVWRATRTFDKNRGAWVTRGLWAMRNHGGTAILFAPTAWRPIP